MAELHVRKQAQLADCAEPFDGSSSFQKAVRFGDAALSDTLIGHIAHINERNEKDRKDAIYSDAMKNMAANAIGCYEAAIAKFESIRGWRDADSKITECQNKIAEIKAEIERKREADRIAAEKAAKKAKKIAKIAVPAVVAVIAILLVITKIVIPNCKYNDALVLMDSGKYEEAVTAFEALDGYKDSSDKIMECKYNIAVALMDEGEYEEAIAAFEALDGYKDSEAKIVTCETETLKTAKVDDIVYFGAYEQDNDKSDGKEAIEWLVLAKKENKLLVISKYALDCQMYNTDYTDVTWESCTLRTWLNDEFLNEAFSADERSYIAQTTVTADENPEYDTDPGNDTKDKVFLLSIDEVEEYFSSDDARQCEPTDYAVANGAYESDSGDCWWWLRSPGDSQYDAAGVYGDGSVSHYGDYVDCDIDAVRPALWINLDS